MVTSSMTKGAPVIMCGVCKKPISSVTCERDFLRDGFVYTAQCHGQEETVFLSRYVVEDGCRIMSGVAFAQNALIKEGENE